MPIQYIFINGRPITMDEFGPAADMRLDDGFQHLIDTGVVGNYPKGTPWWKVLGPDCFSIVKAPDNEGELVEKLYADFKTACAVFEAKSVITEADKDELADKLARFEMARKLSKA